MIINFGETKQYTLPNLESRVRDPSACFKQVGP